MKMRKNQKQKATIVGLVTTALCLLMFTITMSFAFFTARNNASSNSMQFGTLEVSVGSVALSKDVGHELVPGCTINLEGIITLGSSTIEAFVRIKPEVNITTWNGTVLSKMNAQNQLKGLIICAFEKEDSNNVKQGDFIRATGDNAYLYYAGKFLPSSSTALDGIKSYDFASNNISFEVDRLTIGNDWQGCEFTVKITADAIQAQHVGVDSVTYGASQTYTTKQALVDAIANASVNGDAWGAVSAGESVVEITPLEDLNVSIVTDGTNSQGASFNGISEMKSLSEVVSTNSSLVNNGNNAERTVKVCGNSNTGTSVIVPDYVLNDNGTWKKAVEGQSLEADYNKGLSNVYKVTEIGLFFTEEEVFNNDDIKGYFIGYIVDMQDETHKSLYAEFKRVHTEYGYEYYEITYQQMMSTGNEFIYNDFKDFLVEYVHTDNYEDALQATIDDMIRFGSTPAAFFDSLVSIQLPNTITEIYSLAFAGCYNLSSISIPSSLKIVGHDAFVDCDSLELTLYDNAYYLGNFENPHFVLVKQKPNITSCVIHANTKIIGAIAFGDYNSSIKEIVIPNGVVSICESAFIGQKIRSITIPNSVEYICSRAFKECYSLMQVTIGSGVTFIGDNIFSKCIKLVQIRNLSGKTINGLEPNPGQEIITNNGAFNGTLAPIEDYIIYTYNNEKYVMCFNEWEKAIINNLPNDLTSVYQEAFISCSSITSVILPNGLTNMGDKAFYNCSSLTSVSVPSSLAYIGELVFFGCDLSVANNSFYEDATMYYLGNSVNNFVIAYKVKDDTISSFSFNSGTNVIYDYAFQNCRNLTSIQIPNTIGSIGFGAFQGCSVLASVTFESGSQLKTIGSWAFAVYRDKVAPYNLHVPIFEEIIIPSSVTKIKGYAFRRCTGLLKVTFESPNYNEIVTSASEIVGGSFAECDNVVFYYDGNIIPAGNGWKDLSLFDFI